jgi:hypothetical protein
MPIFDVRYADGSTVAVEAPQGTPQEQIVLLANERRRAGTVPPAATPQAPAEQDVTAQA